MKTSKSAHYQRQYRQRLRDKGLVKKEVWILPSRATDLYFIEQQLRYPATEAAAPSGGEGGLMEIKNNHQVWTTTELYEALKASDLCAEGRASVEVINSAEPCLHIIMSEYGDLPLFLTVSRRHMLVEAVLWPLSGVKDPGVFNREVLRTHKFFPLSTIGLDVAANGEEYYIMFGSLSASSILANVVFEIESLADNVIRATEAYEDFLNITG